MSTSTPNAISTPSTSPTITTDALIIGFGKGGKTLAAKLSAAGRKVGLIKLRVFRPFPGEELAAALSHVKAVAVMDKSEGFSACGGPVYAETCAACYALEERPVIVNIVYGLGGRDVATGDIERVFDHLFLLVNNGGKGPKYIHMGQRSSAPEVF